MDTIALDPTSWDLFVDPSGNIATATEDGNPDSLSQDAASAIRLFQGELWYDTSQGIPYFQQILGKFPSLTLLKSQFVSAAQSVPGVVSAKVFISSITGRTVAGQVQVTDKDGNVTAASF